MSICLLQLANCSFQAIGQSHLIPHSYYKRLEKDFKIRVLRNHTDGNNLIRTNLGEYLLKPQDRKAKKGHTEGNLLCASCDSKLGEYEGELNKFLYSAWKQNQSSINLLEKIVEIKIYRKCILAMIGIFWKCNWAQKDPFDLFHLAGPDREIMREILHGQRDPFRYTLFLSRIKDLTDKGAIFPPQVFCFPGMPLGYGLIMDQFLIFLFPLSSNATGHTCVTYMKELKLVDVTEIITRFAQKRNYL